MSKALDYLMLEFQTSVSSAYRIRHISSENNSFYFTPVNTQLCSDKFSNSFTIQSSSGKLNMFKVQAAHWQVTCAF